MNFFKQAKPVFFMTLSIFCLILGFAWLSQTPSFEELQGDTVRAADYFWGMRSVKGWPWWTPNYLLGHSQALFSVSFLPLLVFVGFATAVGAWLPAVAAFKIVGIAIIFCGGVSMFCLAERLLENQWVAAGCGLLYAASAQFVLRVAMLEHLSTAACMIFAPLILWRLLRCEENASWRNALLLAMSVAAMALCYVKILVLFLPAAGIFLIWRFWQSSFAPRRNLGLGCLRGALLTFFLGVVAMLPVLRESRWLAGFEMEPFDGWQQAFSFFTGLSWIDYGNILTSGSLLPPFLTTRHPAVDFYLGGTVLLGILLPIWLSSWRPALLQSPLWRHFRIFCALLLMAAWLSSGPRSLFFSHLAFLSGAFPIPDISIALAWAILIVQGVIIWHLWSGARYRLAGATLSIAVYFFVPGFRILEFLPFFQDIRAPHSVWTAFGTLAAVVATGAGWSLVAEIVRVRWQRVLGLAVLLALVGLDIAFLHQAFFRPGLPAKTFTDFEEAQHALAEGRIAGSVLCLSGRYFYLTTPKYSGRAVATEALLRHFQSRWIRQMEKRSQTSFAALKAYYNLFGIAYILIDRKDTESLGTEQDPFNGFYPQVFQNEYFTLLENKDSLAPAYLFRRVLQAPEDSFLHGEKLLELGQQGFASVESAEGPFDGRIENDGTAQISQEILPLPPERLHLRAPRTQNYHQFTVEGLPSDAMGLVVVTEVYHPDWRAEQNGIPLPVQRAIGALISIQVKKPGPVTFTFTPPWWYSGSLWVSTASWVLAFSSLAFFRLPLAPPALRKKWRLGHTPPPDEPPAQRERAPIVNPLVVIPTWNEAASINEAIGGTLNSAPDCHILVVDDSSSDGTVEAVKAHPAYNTRLFLLERLGKLGLGSAYREGFDWALKRNYDACIEMDADLSHNPVDIAQLLTALNQGADAAIGSRYIGGVRVLNWPQSRLFLSLGASQFVRLATGLPLTDGTSGFKALRAETLRRLDWNKFAAEGYGFQVELHYFLWKSQARLVEVPIIFTERRKGKSKMNVGIAIEAFWRVVHLAIFGK